MPQVHCPPDAQPAIVQVVDSCDHCTPTQINVHYLTFSRFIANPSLGNVSVKWQQVDARQDFRLHNYLRVSCYWLYQTQQRASERSSTQRRCRCRMFRDAAS